MKRRLTAVLTVLAAAAISATSAWGQAKPTLLEIGGARFPDRSYLLTLPPGTVVTPEQVTVLENGKGVIGLKAVPAEETNKSLGVVIAIDTSDSMRGAPLEAAMSAARAFAAQRKPTQQLAVLTFNSEITTVLPFTTDAYAIVRRCRQRT